MRRLIAWTFVCWFGACTAWEPLTAPLTFGMSKEDVEGVLRTSLTYVSGRRGSEVYLAVQPARIPGIYPVDERITLQFRKYKLTGWKFDWDRRHAWFW
jgi:hypothetical protein